MAYFNEKGWHDWVEKLTMATEANPDSTRVEKIDVASPVFQAFKIINNALMDNAHYEHLTMESKTHLNKSLVDLAQMIVESLSRGPQFVITKD